ncbi:MAG: hypothetical protein KF753_04540 [Caldilineaceae bacterium]|nr:hypothetical protein [Caldilineaceae bacterium]
MANTLDQLRQAIKEKEVCDRDLKHFKERLRSGESETKEVYRTLSRAAIDGHNRDIAEREERVNSLQSKSWSLDSTISKLLNQLTQQERLAYLEEQRKKKEDEIRQQELERKRKEQEEQERRARADKARREKDERDRRLREHWRAEGRCEICGRRLGLFDKLFGRTRCKKHR